MYKFKYVISFREGNAVKCIYFCMTDKLKLFFERKLRNDLDSSQWSEKNATQIEIYGQN